MTLVVATTRGSAQCTLYADTQFENMQTAEIFPFDALKILTVRPDLAIGFAGIGLPAVQDTVESCLRENPTMLTADLIDRLAAHDVADMEYLVADSADGVSLTRIRNGTPEPNLHTTYIGDADAFNVYQEKLKHAPRDDDSLHLRVAFDDTIGSPAAPTVGGTFVHVELTSATEKEPGGWRYVPDGEFVSGVATMTSDGEHLMLTALVGNATSTLQKCVPDKPGFPAIGLYFEEPNIGYLLAAPSRDRRQLFSDLSIREFLEECTARVGTMFVAHRDPMGRQS